MVGTWGIKAGVVSLCNRMAFLSLRRRAHIWKMVGEEGDWKFPAFMVTFLSMEEGSHYNLQVRLFGVERVTLL